ncbi:hypoxanthine phosphoribosyltransferase [Desulfonispora thiosulfatigenes DSM 11270]|uniref:Hypoxanthine phosphoribosyltransferase n=1 Tax=Desulfonispora thiosulfatigenes DSM 11270 TaxID=656914 RepID=A0A1W1VDK2_DESTI|nr:hypoxanthine phosphoribosyltransferase [Desulfonispora thiosulfatigenes]SMB91517.1 hypoxanthine phosphoribosyltransferase [Desulfonispora thiosulfatigenes DSM 11270]
MKNDIKEILLTEEQIKTKVAELGAQISKDYKGKDLIVICILKGATPFMADLIREIKIPMAIDFMAVSSYGVSTQSSGVVRILKDLDTGIENKDVLIIEDIVDSGLTLKYLLENLSSRKANSVKVCTFLEKTERREINVIPDYKGYDIPNEFVVGYGLDFAEKYRNLPYIGVLKPEIYS